TFENGQETGRVTRDSFVSKDPVDKIVEVGTKEEQPTQPSKPDAPVKPVTPAKLGQTNEARATLPNTGTVADSASLMGLLLALTGLFLMKKKEK
ncbi:LPXTG cell wall anchor domain-containing protein, partial [Streptococcus sp. DD04]|uniref:LPXTG cell wall anchor domain-containing protein n=1 Tax=Streptococcus sp. DD04 TaxID=1776578 RepID=UPI0012E7B5D7